MKSSSLSLSGDLRKKLSECEVGETEKLTLTVKITGTGEDMLMADVTGVEYESGEDEPAPKPKLKGPNRPKALMKAIDAY